MRPKYTIRILKRILPPVITDALISIKASLSRRPRQWEYMPAGWQAGRENSKILGWNVPSILQAYHSKWQWFCGAVKTAEPFDFTPESIPMSHTGDLKAHNTMMSYAYAFGIASNGHRSISMLDWGGNIGHYYLISKALFPGLEIDYHCKDVSIFVDAGRKLIPDGQFYDDDSCLRRSYLFVLMSSALQYSQDWMAALKQISIATEGYLYITRTPIVRESPSFVVVQRPYHHQYNTEYLGWCINRVDLLKLCESSDLMLVREFVLGDHPRIHAAPEQPEMRGFLFKKRTSGSLDVSRA